MSVCIVAELGQNTNGKLDMAISMAREAKEAGCDGVKVQLYELDDFLPRGHSDWDMLERGRLSFDDVSQLREVCREIGLLFGATPSSIGGVEFLHELEVDWLKNGSDFIIHRPMIDAMLDTGIYTWISTGMATEEEIFSIYHQFPDAMLMLCTSMYPCPPDQAGLARLSSGIFSGFSDHTEGTLAAVLATGFGVSMIEKHVTLDKRQDGPDHRFSANFYEMKSLVNAVREAETLLGDGELGFMPGEIVGRSKWRVTEGTLRSE